MNVIELMLHSLKLFNSSCFALIPCMVVTRSQAAAADRLDTFCQLASEASTIAVDGLVCQIRPDAPVDTEVAAARAVCNDLPRSRTRSPRFRRWGSGWLHEAAPEAAASSIGIDSSLPLGGYIAKYLLNAPASRR